jgi:TolB-like protein
MALLSRQHVERACHRQTSIHQRCQLTCKHSELLRSDGISEELLNLLAQVPQLHVVGRTSSFSFKGKATSIKDIGQALNVTTVLEGGVRKAGDQLRVSAQLINVADGYQLWSQTYDRKLTDIFAVQDDIARRKRMSVE